jgi:hypothetical protein
MKLPRPTVPVSRPARRRRGPGGRAATLALLSVLVLALLPAPAHADDAAPRTTRDATLAYTESGCTEVAYQRGGLESAVRPLVPERFALDPFPGVPEGAPARVQLAVNEVTCDRGSFPGVRRDERRYTFILVSAFVTATTGDQRDGAYVLFAATESKAQRAAFRRLGWSFDALSRRTETLVSQDTTGTPVGSTMRVVGGGWDHDLVASVTAPLPVETTPTLAEYYRDTDKGPLTACYANRTRYTGAAYSGDLRGTPFATVAYVPPIFTGYPGSLVVGGWDVTVTSAPCPR